ncbi:MAG: hypothetical protein ACYST0_00215 [Planctomycetota bacterium]|jgi:hypothetical protein
MRIGHLIVAALASSSFAFAQSGLSVPESQGIVVTGDFSDDGCDDALVLGVRGSARNYHGQKAQPYFRKGTMWFGPGYWQLGDVPVFVGKHLYVPVLDVWNSYVALQVYAFVGGSWQLKKAVHLFTGSTQATVTSMRVCGLGRDIDSDKLEDVILVWSEHPATKAAYHVAEVSPKGMQRHVAIPPQIGQHDNAMIAGVHQSRSLSRKPREFLVTLTAPWSAFSGGFGFMIIDDLKVGKVVWANMGPTLFQGGQSLPTSAVTYGNFGLMKQLGAPLIMLNSGPSVVFEPWFVSPYIRNKGEWIYTDDTDAILDKATGDYDGDGVDEVVILDTTNIVGPVLLYVGDPSTKRPYLQIWNLWDGKYPSPYVFHGGNGDFNGDGKLDLVLSYLRGSSGHMALFLNTGAGPGKASLRRVY